MAELAARSGLSVATIKYYLREGLLHSGEAVGQTRTRYDDSHVRRLRLIRALTDVANLRLDTVRSVIEGIEQAKSWPEAVGSAHRRLVPEPLTAPSDASLARVDGLLDRRGWTLREGGRHRETLAHALDTVAELGDEVDDELLDTYGDAMARVATVETARLDPSDRERAAELAVMGTLLLEPVLLTVRRIAQENAARAARGESI
ncbi:MerR family transcriptional regulator [Smaragdicoccus niigatensis]|uniref:MerR family transcriptional regulator n=1 Tax=Smaragdicoccus niigatensis TaxID=359359 RepID=UPI00039B63D6|nr:MerR family transcriptional regulator [Smaragdicoccus niigatensis]